MESPLDHLNERSSYALAFSGGVDSSYLLTLAIREGYDIKPYFVKTAFQADWELRDAREVASRAGAELEVIEADVLSHEDICANPENRCYLCKQFIFSTIERAAHADGRDVILDGTNASDDPSRRPGMKALAERGVVSPLRLASLTKDDIRQASRELGLFTADKPNYSCYAVKIPTGTPITERNLAHVAEQEADAAHWND